MSMEVLSDEIEPVATKTDEFENRQIKFTNWTFSLFQAIISPNGGTQPETVPSGKHLKLYHR